MTMSYTPSIAISQPYSFRSIVGVIALTTITVWRLLRRKKKKSEEAEEEE